jgi:hypothetical protein
MGSLVNELTIEYEFKGMNLLEPEDNLSAVLSSFWEEIFPKVEAYTIPIILERVKFWVGDQPEMTESLCSYIVQEAAQFTSQTGDKEAKLAVDKIVQKELVDGWENSFSASHLNAVKTALLEYDRRDSLLILYIQVLQRGEVPVSKSPEQAVLLDSGLVKIDGDCLKMTNAIYAKVFDLDWVEQQLPGITKPVSVVDETANKRLFSGSLGSNLSVKIAAAVFGLAVLSTAIFSYTVFSYTKEPGREAIAMPNALLRSSSEADSPNSSSSENPSSENPSSKNFGLRQASSSFEQPLTSAADGATEVATIETSPDRALFDNGAEHAQNSRWVPMMRDFCALSEESAYFAPAQKRLELWAELYIEDIEMARDIVAQEQAGPCTIANNVLGEAIN